MGLKFTSDSKTDYLIDMAGKSVLDVGAGPCSLLLKCVNVIGKVIDPCQFPQWVYKRYAEAMILYSQEKAEDMIDAYPPIHPFDEVWCYNVLQHVEDPQLCVENMMEAGKLIRIFEWIDTPSLNIGHPNTLREDELNQWLQGEGKTEFLSEKPRLYGRCYYGVFPGYVHE